MRRPSARSRAARAAASSRVMAGASRLPAEAECLPQLRARDRGGTPLHHHDPTRDVRERRGNGGRGAARPGGGGNGDGGGAPPPGLGVLVGGGGPGGGRRALSLAEGPAAASPGEAADERGAAPQPPTA